MYTINLINKAYIESYDFNKNGYWSQPIPNDEIDYDLIESNKCVKLFDQNGYDLCPLEKEYAKYNDNPLNHLERDVYPSLICHRNEKHYSLQKEWYIQADTLKGCVLNHSMLLERKGYSGDALKQLRKFAERNPLIYKVVNITPKWGLDFSLDYVDETGESFEVLHHEFDCFSPEEAQAMRIRMDSIIETTDFESKAKELIERKMEWVYLEFFEQSDWKCNFFHIPKERFKMICWQN